MFTVAQFWNACWLLLLDTGIWLLLGFGIAGILHVLLPAATIVRYLKGNGIRQTLSAVMIGAPIPLCSCSVLPVAKTLRDRGAGRGATAGFLISAPETGADAISISWALLGPVWAIARPIAAIFTAVIAGMLQPKDGENEQRQQVISVEESIKIDDCCVDCDCSAEKTTEKSKTSKVTEAIHYAFIEQPTDLARYLLPGFLLAGLVAVLFPPSSLSSYANGLPVYAAAILIGLPLYICSTASTPLAASFLAAGVSPGPILTFLLVGPATNVTSFAAVRKLLGAQGLAIQLVTIVGVAVLCGLILDAVQIKFGGLLTTKQCIAPVESIQVWEVTGALLLILLLVIGLYRDLVLKKR